MDIMKKITLLSYALIAYTVGMASLLYLMGFLINLYVPKSIDSGTTEGLWLPLFSNMGLLVAYFAIHSVMARPWFKAAWQRIIPAGTERSTYILISGVTVFLLVLLWQPLTTTIWLTENPIARNLIITLYLGGWTLMTLATFNINHFAFFGLQQAWASLRSQRQQSPGFSARYLYALTRHPISLGWLIVMWATPAMSLGHLLMAIVATLYIFIITPVEEADLVAEIGDDYRHYQQTVRRFLPIPKKVAQ
ncbi:MAG: hypothetical protein CMK83_22235 [Pseudomonadales bacterium]|jgi:protein-S-isoprenylcysteine O-methyltransferase Ste14|nr:hypothetical protein [Pseudomonadales bacterium]RLT91885.1 MAG: isoprenylcysteine carboxylmethyltransferase family protein [Ketobacter sp. GenoA1]RLT93889.1 MAG: isoprenylcysteine carboxylmethyltransferase family protein [Ketobacter sp.]HAG94441.1 hypothetical protein [Gammaproteobacteria bacterium]HAU14408.1 hypothetical protein [Gammaproteobacteria bacterium]|tara:strand:+ start:2634 stop:3380 length:747 start_codon:yes stop_codon:yes gene_type:complete